MISFVFSYISEDCWPCFPTTRLPLLCQGGYVFGSIDLIVSLSVCLFVSACCLEYDWKNYGWILVKFSEYGIRNR